MIEELCRRERVRKEGGRCGIIYTINVTTHILIDE